MYPQTEHLMPIVDFWCFNDEGNRPNNTAGAFRL